MSWVFEQVMSLFRDHRKGISFHLPLSPRTKSTKEITTTFAGAAGAAKQLLCCWKKSLFLLPPSVGIEIHPFRDSLFKVGSGREGLGGRKKKGDFSQQQSNCFAAAAAPAKVVVISFVLLVRGERGR